MDRSRRQAGFDFALFTSAGLIMALYNYFTLDFPFVQSGLKLVLGTITLGLFTSIDLALQTEHTDITTAMHRTGGNRLPPDKFSPLTNRFFMLASIITVLMSAIVILVIFRDIYWLNSAGTTEANMGILKRSILTEISFVMGVLLLYVINLIYSYSRNLRLLFNNQTSVLKHVSSGEMERYVPVTTRDEFGVIAGYTNSMIDALRDRLQLRKGLLVAQEIQQTLLPVSTPRIEGVDIAFACIFSDETGGDFFDFLDHGTVHGVPDSPKLSIVVGDVTGHGIGAALLMASARAYLRMQSESSTSPAELLTKVNTLLTKDNYGTGRFVTLFTLQLDTQSKEVLWASAGHDPAITYTAATGLIDEMRATGLPLGVTPESTYHENCCRLFSPGDIIVIGTDGIWEAMSPAGVMLGKDRLRDIIAGNATLSAQGIVNAITKAVTAHLNGAEQYDDVTLVVLKFLQ